MYNFVDIIFPLFCAFQQNDSDSVTPYNNISIYTLLATKYTHKSSHHIETIQHTRNSVMHKKKPSSHCL
jgi:hypothetical protein